MDLEKAILVKTFASSVDADLAASELRAHGIKCVITSDDCAGMYPSLGVIKLLVDPSVAEDAREILKQSEAAPSVTEDPVDEKNPPRSVPAQARAYRFNWGLVAGVFVGALLHYSYVHFEKYRDGNDWWDKDENGLPEEERIWRRGENTEARFDRNGDSRIDAWIYYRKSQSWRDEMDDNFDGRVDSWFVYGSHGFLIRAELDTDRNGIRDVDWTFTNALLHQADWRPNGTNVVLLRQLFRHGVLNEELRDLNGDGWFDVSIKFDAFNTPIRTNSLRPTTQVP